MQDKWAKYNYRRLNFLSSLAWYLLCIRSLLFPVFRLKEKMSLSWRTNGRRKICSPYNIGMFKDFIKKLYIATTIKNELHNVCIIWFSGGLDFQKNCLHLLLMCPVYLQIFLSKSAKVLFRSVAQILLAFLFSIFLSFFHLNINRMLFLKKKKLYWICKLIRK